MKSCTDNGAPLKNGIFRVVFKVDIYSICIGHLVQKRRETLIKYKVKFNIVIIMIKRKNVKCT